MLFVVTTIIIAVAIAWYFDLLGGGKKPALKAASPTSSPTSASGPGKLSIPTNATTPAGKSAGAGSSGALIMYASQTGTAAIYAKTLHKEGTVVGVPNRLVDVEEYSPSQLPDEKLVIVVVATYGEGEPTDSMKAFNDWLFDDCRSDNELEGLKFAVFGLGDKQYKFYCQMGVEVDKRMAALGATRVYGLGQGDAGRTIEEDFEDWRKDLWPAVGHALGIPLKDTTDEPYEPELKLAFVEEGAALPYPKMMTVLEPTNRTPAWGTITASNELLKDGGAEKRSTKEIAVDITGSHISYQSGDHLGVLPCNSDDVVDQYLSLLNIDSETAGKIVSLRDDRFKNVFPARVAVREALKWYIDLSGVPKKSTLRAFAHCCTDENEKKDFLGLLKVTHDAQDKFRKLASKLRNVAGFLRKYQSCSVPLNLFLEAMPRMAPRYFSISSDQLTHPNAIHITVAVVADGVCTTMLAKMQVGDKVPVFVRKSNFHLPLRAKNRPIIMIGPGTGVAPLIGFMHRRRAWKEKGNDLGDALLFFGCRNKSEDFIYEEFLGGCVSSGVLTTLDIAFSRDQAQKVYVQHRLKDHGEKLWSLINEGGANVYICGDAKYMAKDVEATLLDIFQKQGGMTADKANDFIAKLEKNGKYLKDVWSA